MISDDSPENELRRREEASRRRLEASMKGFKVPRHFLAPGSHPPPLPPETGASGEWSDVYHAPRSQTLPPRLGPTDAWLAMMRRRRAWMWLSFLPIIGFPLFSAVSGYLGVLASIGWLAYCASQIVAADIRPPAFPAGLRIFGWVLILFVLNIAVVISLFFAACGVIALFYNRR